MHRRLPKRAMLLVAVATMLPWAAAIPGAQAGHLAPPPMGIMQDGDGAGNSAPVTIEGDGAMDNFFMRTVLFNGSRFPLPNGQTQRPGFKKYAAWGTQTQDNGDHLLAFSTSDTGALWTAPQTATLQDPETGEDVPFVIGTINNIRQFAVVYTPTFIDFQFAIYYMRHDPADPADVYDIENMRSALSNDGVRWIDSCGLTTSGVDCSIEQSAASPVIAGAGAGTFKDGSYGPTDVKFQTSGSTAATCGAVNPWNCRWVMVYDALGGPGGDEESTGIAWSGDGITWTGTASPIIGVGAPGEWDDTYATMTHIAQLSPHDFVAYYSGGQAPPSACYGGLAPCFSLGTAYSSDGVTFTKSDGDPETGVRDPVTPSTLTSGFQPDAPHSLWHAQAVGDAGGGRRKVLYSLISDAIAESLMMGRQYPIPPAPGIVVRIDNPVPGATPVTESRMIAYVSDNSGTTIGIDAFSVTAELENLTTLAVTPITGLSRAQSLIGSLRHAGYKITKNNFWTNIVDGSYELRVTAFDLDGNSATGSVQFTIDRTPPETLVTAEPLTPAVKIPGDSIGVVEGTTTDLTSPVLGLRAIVTNPLGLEKVYEVNYFAGQPSNPPMGFTILSRSTDGKALTWRWVAPGLDLHTILPGPYIISVIGFDTNFNIEQPDSANTTEVFVV